MPRARQHPLPWILFAVTLVSLGAIGVLLAMRVKDQSARADVELVKRTRAEEALKAAESARDEATSHVAQLENQLKEAADARDAALKTSEGSAPAAVAAAPAVKKKVAPPKKKKRRR